MQFATNNLVILKFRFFKAVTMNRGIITASGYILFALGFLSILLSIVGLQLTPLKWLSNLGAGPSIIIKISMLFGGLIIMYISKMPPEDQEEELM